MNKLRAMIIPVGLMLPFFSRLLGGPEKLDSYLGESAVTAILVMSLFNMIAWGSLFAFSFAFHRIGPFLIPCVVSYAYFGVRHYHLDLTGHENAVLEIFWIPVSTLGLIILTAGLGFLLDRKLVQTKSAI